MGMHTGHHPQCKGVIAAVARGGITPLAAPWAPLRSPPLAAIWAPLRSPPLAAIWAPLSKRSLRVLG